MRVGSRWVPASVVLARTALSLALVPAIARADWPQFGRAICTQTSTQVHPTITTDGAGGAIVTWQDFRLPRVNVFAQHVLASGNVDATWPVDGRALLDDPIAIATADGGQTLPVIVADGAGGAIVVWQDLRTGDNEFDLFAQHVLAAGIVDGAWPANGRAVSATLGDQDRPAVVSDGAGGAIVTWMDTRPGSNDVDIYAQRVLVSGVADPRWPVNGVALCTAAGRQEFPVIVADGAGGAIVSWGDGRSTVTGFDVYAQHVLESGVVDPAWPADGRALCTAAGDQGRPTIVPDGAHGAVIAWGDGRVVNTFHIFAQHIFSTGVVDAAWPVNGRAISAAAATEGLPIAVTDGAGGAIVSWQAVLADVHMFAQHVRATGILDPGWPAAGRSLSSSVRQQTHGDIAPDGFGGAIVAWDENADVFAQHVLASGALDPGYPSTGRVLTAPASGQGDPAVVATGNDGAIVAWTDSRTGTSTDIFALQVLETGDAGVGDPPPPGLAFARPSPNPARNLLTLRFSLPRASLVSLVVYDPSGRRVRALVSGIVPAGDHSLTWDLRDENGRAVRPGVYLARLEAEGASVTHKVTALEP